MRTKPHPADGKVAEPSLFLLRVWLECGAFRAALREVGGAEPQVFTQPTELGEYLCRSLRSSSGNESDVDRGETR
jgi:hypothetical protein